VARANLYRQYRRRAADHAAAELRPGDDAGIVTPTYLRDDGVEELLVAQSKVKTKPKAQAKGKREATQKAKPRVQKTPPKKAVLKKSVPKKATPHDLLSEVLDSSPVGVAISRLSDSVVVYANAAMAAFFGVPRTAARGRKTETFFADPNVREKIRETLAGGGEIKRYPVRSRIATGAERSSLFSCRLIDYQGAPSIFTWLEDETERDRREHAIISASRQVEMLHQLAGIGNRAVNLFDALRKGTAEIARCIGWPVGLAYRQAHGDDELLQLASLSLPKDSSKYEGMRKILMGQSFHLGEDLPGRVLASKAIEWVEDVANDPACKRFSADDPVRIVSALGIPIIADDKVVAVLELLTDQRTPPDEILILTLTQISSELGRVHLRDQMTVALQEARAEAESSARAKASFLAAMSHEVRTPMNGVVGMVDLVLQTKLDDEQRFMLQTVKDSGHALITVINDILDFSKIEAGRLEIERAEFSVAKILEDVALSLAPVAAQKKLSLITYADPKLPEVVLGDAVRVRQILSNLGANAVKFSETGEIVLKAEAGPSGTPGHVRVRFSVRDEGVGISQEAKERLFEEFQQADSSTTRRFGGTGLGLAICRRLTDLMGGEIGVDSLLGVGSEFRCLLPFPVVERREEKRSAADLAGLRVLVIAESDELRGVCANYLGHWKAEVETASKLRECLPRFQDAKKQGRPIDIIVIARADDPRQVAALREGFVEAGLMPYPRFVVGRDARVDVSVIAGIKEITLVDAYPVRRAALISAVAIAAGRASPETMVIDTPEATLRVAAPSVEEALADGRLILVAEDQISNQEVIRRQLNRLGYACEIAKDGMEALKMWRSKPYALLLTDCHMPHMDGFGLTAAVRNLEKNSNSRAPIIAITANVLQGEAERCLASGMDGFLPKPVDLKTLRAALEKWIDHAPATVDETPAPEASPVLPVLDLTQVHEVFGGIDDGVRKIYGTYLNSVKPLLAKFSAEMTGARHLEARETIHKACGATANAGGKELAALMRDVERALAENRTHDAESAARFLQPAWDRLEQAIAAI
jgi:PAS domain S-box-containing protein